MPQLTDIINLFDVDNQIKSITGTFRYRFFDPIEQVDEDNRFVSNDQLYPPDTVGTPRYNRITWKTSAPGLVDVGLKGNAELIHKKNFFFASDLSPTYCLITVAEKELIQKQNHAISDNATTGSKLEYLLTTISSNEYTEDIEQNLDSARDSSKIPVIDPTTNRPLEQVSITDTVQIPDIQIRARNIQQVLDSSHKSPLSRGIWGELKEKASIIAKKKASVPNPDSRKLTTFFHTILKLKSDTKVKFPSVSRKGKPRDYLTTWQPVGFAISKYRVAAGKETYMYTRFVPDVIFDDPHVAYGQTYRYQLRPVYAKYLYEDVKIGDDTVIFLGSEESAYIDIQCIEEKIPEPPRNPRFEYVQNSNIRISWERPQSFVSDDRLVDTNDIKGYQLFVRNSLKEPYQLYRYFKFNNTQPSNLRMYSMETISDDYVISSEYDFPDSIPPDDIPKFYEFKEYIVPIRSNVDYYFALCSIDAHGNSSNYSAQYKARRNNVTGEVDIQLICPVGAPKQYPNLLIPGKLVQPSMKVSGYRYMDTYFCPDSMMSVPNLTGESVNIQLFELETEIEKNITITMKQMPKSTK
jgi:hypothetical protein